MKKKAIKIIILIIATALAVVWLWPSKPAKQPEIYLSVASELKEIVRLTTLEGERVVPIKYLDDGIGAFGIGHYRVRISFDIEQMPQMVHHDTLYVVLPEPEVQILEHDEFGFTVYDVWGDNIATRLIGAHLSTAAENEMKRRAMAQLRRELQSDGSIVRAKSQAIESLHKLFGIIPGMVVILDSPSRIPEGATRIPLDQPNTTIKKR